MRAYTCVGAGVCWSLREHVRAETYVLDYPRVLTTSKPWQHSGTPDVHTSVPLQYPRYLYGSPQCPVVPSVPLQYPLLPPETLLESHEYPSVPPTYLPTTPDLVRPRTSVGARPHVPVVVRCGAAAAADDVDGAGGVDHRRVPRSGSPRRAECAARPRRTCGQRAPTLKPMKRTQRRTRGHRVPRGNASVPPLGIPLCVPRGYP